MTELLPRMRIRSINERYANTSLTHDEYIRVMRFVYFVHHGETITVNDIANALAEPQLTR